MRRNYFLFALMAAFMLLVSNVAVSAQTGQLFGEVKMRQPDGKVVPVAGAQIDVYRTDIPAEYHTKTDKGGKFVFAGLPFVGSYMVAASAPGARPDVARNIKAGREFNVVFTLDPGDGKRFTRDEAKAVAAGGGRSNDTAGGTAPAEVSAEDRKKIEEMKRKNAEIEEANKKATASNETINRTFKAGNEALRLGDEAKKANNRAEAIKQYDAAVALYDEGIAADPSHPGAPSLMTNKSFALTARGVQHYNESIQAKDDAAKAASQEAAKKDFRAAVESANRAVEMLKAQPQPTDPAGQQNLTTNKYFALSARAEAMRFFVTKVDGSQADAGLAAFQEYIAAETDPAKKAKAQVDVAQMLLDSGSADKAYAEFQKALTENPDNVDALLGAGLSLFASGDKAKYQDAANFLQRFVDKAPETHKFKADAKAVLENLKSQENIKPQKTTPPPGRRRG